VNKAYVRPGLPHTPLSVLHLAGDIKSSPQKIRTTADREREMLLTYSAFKTL